ncbi:class I SAM-dependent methyltransferase [Acetobacter conturbans]|uniref:DUF4347 domain-containing protein n=1 Tax=Acetobacter conturbans TaxID=1737472 RepID=A0ABX0JWM9_9PROT|nr:hypothetical protein [Acetobacter conturbans]NHN87901.1 hypothetical protein [Acetobacter conturbans]
MNAGSNQTSTASCSFSVLSTPDLNAAFLPPSPAGEDLATYAHLPLLATVFLARKPRCAAFIATAPSVLAHVHTLIATQDLDTRVLILDGTAPFPPSAEPIDLLHLDATRIEDSASVLEWLKPHLAPDAVLLLHGTETAAGSPLWKSLTAKGVHFLFPHEEGLGIVAPLSTPPALHPLLGPEGIRLDPSALGRLRARCAQLGLFWAKTARLNANDAQQTALRQQQHALELSLTETRLALSNTEERAALGTHHAAAAHTDASPEIARLKVELALANSHIATVQQNLSATRDWIATTTRTIDEHNQHLTTFRQELASQNEETQTIGPHSATRGESFPAFSPDAPAGQQPKPFLSSR